MHTYGAKTPESQTFHLGVYETIQTIPYGRVTSYALLLGAPEKSRQVGFALKHLPRAVHEDTRQEDLPEFNINTVPWWRVINSQGKVSLVEAAKQRQITRLRQEDVVVTEDGKVNFEEYGWFEMPDFD